jgi:iron complex outermembrane receptor protein
MAELFITANQNGLEIYPNPDLKPESGWSAEIGIKQGVKFGNWMGYLDVAGFLMQYDDMMEFSFGLWGDKGPGFKSLNVGKTQISGIEFSTTGQGKINDNITINLLAGYTYMNPIPLDLDKVYATDSEGNEITYQNSSSDSRILKYRYKHIAKIDTEIAYKKLSIGSSCRYNSFMENIDKVFTAVLVNGNFEDNPLRDDPALNGANDGGTPIHDTYEGMIPGINAAREKFANGDIIIDARLGYQFNDMVRFGFVINNLLNREYMTRPATMMPPRTFAFQCSLKI